MLVSEGKLAQELGKKLLSWRHSGFNLDHGRPVKRKDKAGLERLAQYILRNPFSEEKMIYNREQKQVI
ncbi:transposase, partial [bacterium]|nr:transposase [bacterium]